MPRRALLPLAALILALSVASPAGAQARLDVEETRPELSLGLGSPVVAFWDDGAAVLRALRWVTLPIGIRWPVGRNVAVGLQLVLGLSYLGPNWSLGWNLIPDFRAAGTLRAWAVPDWLFFDFSLGLGFPFIWHFTPAVGLAIPVSRDVRIAVTNSFPMTYVGAFLGVWEPSVGVQLTF